MSTENARIFECFKVGTHTSGGGKTREWESSDLERICRNYLYRTDRAPLVLGHPVENGPAYGEVTDLFHKRGVLYAVANVGKTLIELVRGGKYKHVSASFMTSPTLSGWNLRHIGFLGANPPAVKGLAELAFSDFSKPPGTVSFAAPTGAGVSSAAHLVVPAGWSVSEEGWALYEHSREVQADCPGLSFAEATRLAEKHIMNS